MPRNLRIKQAMEPTGLSDLIGAASYPCAALYSSLLAEKCHSHAPACDAFLPRHQAFFAPCFR